MARYEFLFPFFNAVNSLGAPINNTVQYSVLYTVAVELSLQHLLRFNKVVTQAFFILGIFLAIKT
jgi:hypothetical protein